MNFQTPEEVKMTILLLMSMLFATIFIVSEADAYVPSSQFIFNRVAALHGKGAYVLEDEVNFHEGVESATIHESWIIADGGEMRVQVSGDGVRTYRILKRGRVLFVDENGAERSLEAGPDYYMRPLLTRTPVEEKKIFVGWGILPAEVLREKKLPKEVKDITVETEPFVRLGRVGGDVAYTYGNPSPVQGVALTGLWIEQDIFTIRKMRTPDGSEINLNDYVPYSKGLTFPKSQTIEFENHVAEVRVTKLSAVELSGEQKRQLDVSWLRGRSDAASVWPHTSIGPVIQEFYKRFR